MTFEQEWSALGEVFFEDRPNFPFEVKTKKGKVPLKRLLMDSISSCDIDIRASLFGNILVTGGNSALTGFQERFESGLYAVTPQSSKVRIFSYPKSFNRQFSSWLGASILGSSGSFQNLWITKTEYNEVGSSILARKQL